MTETASKRRTQEERKAESERQIIRAALKLFAEQGYMRTTLNQIGQEAGYTGGLVSHRFGSKEGLLQAVVSHITGRFSVDQMGSAIEQDSAEESLKNYLEIYIREVTLREGRMRTMYVIMGEALAAVPEIQHDIASLNKGVRNVLAEIVQRGIDNGEFSKEVDAQTAAVLILGMLRGVVMQYLADRKAVNVKKMLPVIQGAALSGLK